MASCITSASSPSPSPSPSPTPCGNLFSENHSFHRLSNSRSISSPCQAAEQVVSASETAKAESSSFGTSGENLAFVYGTLKKGFGNHWLMEELMESGHARYVGESRTARKYPLVCGPFKVPFLLRTKDESGHNVIGEVYKVDEYGMGRLDELEGISKGHYERHKIEVLIVMDIDGNDEEHVQKNLIISEAFAYFASSHFNDSMISCGIHLECYSLDVASSYVPRKLRPSHLTFLQHVLSWIHDHHHESISF